MGGPSFLQPPFYGPSGPPPPATQPRLLNQQYLLLAQSPGAARLAVSTQPPPSIGIGPGSKLALGITVLDPIGQTVIAYNAPVSLAIAYNPGAATLHGTTTINATQGVSFFNGLWLSELAGGYTLQATSGNLAPTVTGPIDVTPPNWRRSLLPYGVGQRRN